MPPTADSAPFVRPSLIITVDRLPAWILPAWGATWVAAPAIDALAAEGVVFDRLLTPSMDPRATARDLLGQGHESLLAQAAAAGHTVAVVSDQTAVVEAVELPAGVAVTRVEPTLPAEPAADEVATNLGRLFATAEQVISAQQPALLWVHVGCLGVAWDAPDEFRGAYLDPDDPPPPPGCRVPNQAVDATADPDLLVTLRHVFAAQVTLLDRCVGRLVAAYRTLARPAGGGAILMAGLRGLPLGLHGWIGGAGDGPDRQLPFSESIHVPAVLVDPAGRMAGQRYGGLVTPADLGATLAELTSAPVSRQTGDDPSRGQSLAGLLATWQGATREQVVVRGAAGDAVITPAWHWITAHAAGGDAETLLFAKPDDFFEQANVADRCRDVAEELAGVVRQK